MKDLSKLIIPDIKFAESHEWAKKDNDLIVIGISDYAQDQLGDVVYVEMSSINTHLAQGDEFGTVESVKAVSEIYLPLSGTVIEVNDNLSDNPALVNEAPYTDGWMVKIKPDDMTQFDSLLDKESYRASLKGK